VALRPLNEVVRIPATGISGANALTGVTHQRGLRGRSCRRRHAALRSYLATTAKHGLDGLDALTMLTTGNPWQPEST